MGSCSRSDRHKDDSFPMFIPPLPIQQPSHFFSLLLCTQARERFAVCSARVGFQLSAHSPRAAHRCLQGSQHPQQRPAPEQVGAAWYRGAHQAKGLMETSLEIPPCLLQPQSDESQAITDCPSSKGTLQARQPALQ